MNKTLCEVCGSEMPVEDRCKCGFDCCKGCKTPDGKCYYCACDIRKGDKDG